jgi:carbamate kinase
MMRIVVALGGNALLRRDEPLTMDNQRANIHIAIEQIVKIIPGNELVITHGNGPQVGLLSLQTAAYSSANLFSLDVLGAETEGMIGYMIEQELHNLLPIDMFCATLLTQVEVDPQDPAFLYPTKPIGPVYTQAEAQSLANTTGWRIAPDNDTFRRIVPSPKPKRILAIRSVQYLLEKGCIVICAGGGGIPVQRGIDGKLHGVEAVIDKDWCAALLAQQLNSDLLIIATDVKAVFANWDQPAKQAITEAHPDEITKLDFAVGSMAPKVQAACEFARHTGKTAVIGSLTDIEAITQAKAGTRITMETSGMHYL